MPSNGTPTEAALCRIWAEALGRPEIGATDDFFRVGGHSLLATKTMSVMRRAFRVQLPLSLIFEFPTVAELAPQLERILLEEIEAMTEAEVTAAIAAETRR